MSTNSKKNIKIIDKGEIMKNTVGLIALAVVALGCGILGKKDAANTAAPAPASSSTPSTANPPAATSSAGLTIEKFDQLNSGMKYEDAVKVLGGEGTETSSFSAGSIKSVTYKWEGENSARITATFKNGELTSKIQSNLKSASGDAAKPADVTLAKYNQVQNGMSYEDVVKIIGSEGTQTSGSSIGSIKTAAYKWQGEKYAMLFATFRDNKLSSKSQSNLK